MDAVSCMRVRSDCGVVAIFGVFVFVAWGAGAWCMGFVVVFCFFVFFSPGVADGEYMNSTLCTEYSI